MNLTVQPLTPDLWPAFESLFDTTGPAGRCWCAYWRIGSSYRQRPPEANKAALAEVVRRGPPPGLLAFDGDLSVGWCQLTPREALPWLERNKRLQRVDAAPVWSLSCFYVRKGWRKRGVMVTLIAAAVETARRAGAPALEAYPLDGELTPSTSFTGYLAAFHRAGFRVVARPDPARPIVRYEFPTHPPTPPACPRSLGARP